MGLDDIASGDLWADDGGSADAGDPGAGGDNDAASGGPADGANPGDAGGSNASGPPEPPEPVDGGGSTEPPPEPTTTGNDEPPMVPREAHLDERRKRQAAERELEELRARTAGPQVARQAEPEGDPPDPDAEFFQGPSQYVEKQLNRVVSNMRLELGQDFMRSQHADYDETVQVFVEAARKDYALQARLNASQNPARFAYEMGKGLQRIEKAGSLEKIEADIRAQVTAELDAKYRTASAERAAAEATTSSASANSAGGGGTPPVEPVESMSVDDILGGMGNRF